MGTNRIFIGQRIGMLTIVSEADRKKGNQKAFNVICDCGNRAVMLETNIKRETKGKKSCGCRRTKHGLHKTGAYDSWQSMMKRCYRTNNNRFQQYGAKGIVVCDRWHDFTVFYSDMGDRPEGYTLDRIDNAKGYSPENCRWATPSMQAKNRKTTRNFTINGETKCFKDWCETFGINYAKALARINKLGWDIEKALETK